MKKTVINRRWILLSLSLCFTVAAAAWVSSEEEAAVNIKPAPRRTSAPPDASKQERKNDIDTELPQLSLEKLQQRVALTESQATVFTAKSWYVAPPPPKPTKPLPPAPPSAPPLPFMYMGQFQEESGRLVVYLVQGERVHTIAAGDVIDNLYRVDSATPRQLVLTYLPLMLQQTLPTGTGS